MVFDYGHPYITPSSTVSPFGAMKLLMEGGEEISGEDFEYDYKQNRVLLKNLDHANLDLTLVHNTVSSFSINTGTLATLETTIEAGSDLLVEITDTEFHTSTDLADWIIPQAWVPLSTEEDFPTNGIDADPGLYLSVSEVKTFALHEFRDSFLDSDGSGIATTLEDYVREIRSVDRRTWARIIPGRDGLRDAEAKPLDDYFPHLADPIRGTWGVNEYNINEVQYLGSGVNDPANPLVGTEQLHWQSGTGTRGDLEPGVVRKELRSYADIVEETKVPQSVLYGVL